MSPLSQRLLPQMTASLYLGRGGGSGVVEHAAAGTLGHTHWSMTHSHTRAISTNWEKKRWETMAQPPHTGGDMRGLYPVCQVAELAAGWGYTTTPPVSSSSGLGSGSTGGTPSPSCNPPHLPVGIAR